MKPGGPVALNKNKNSMCLNTFTTCINTIGKCSLVHASSSLCWIASSAACSMLAAPLSSIPRHIYQTLCAIALSVANYVMKCCYLSMSRKFPNESLLVRCIIYVTKCTYSLMLCTPLNVHLVYVNGYHFVLCENLFVTVLIVKQFIVLSETVVFLNI